MKILGNQSNDTLSNKNFNPYSVNEQDINFINLVQNKITGYGQIPYTVPTNLIIDVIEESR
jgi:16S rRNA A1518/A1519 N6-dimethyltransferase RsmA/KsgA/DIM1 with predicted DNA glycosylase/AP lyase activity